MLNSDEDDNQNQLNALTSSSKHHVDYNFLKICFAEVVIMFKKKEIQRNLQGSIPNSESSSSSNMMVSKVSQSSNSSFEDKFISS